MGGHMKEKVLALKENKKALILFILILFMICLGISYAYWYLTHIQSGTNQVVTDCFDIEFIEESEAITLSKAYPMTDEEGSTLTPYTFKISNKCASYVSYQVNLEILNTTTLDSQYVKGMLDSNAKVLTENEVVQTTLDNATTSYKLTTGYLDHNEERTHTFRLWIDENVGMDDPVSNKTFEGKITITASYITEIPTDYDLCVEKYGEDSINCNIIAQLDDTGACPEVNEDGTVKITKMEATNNYLCSAPDDYGTSYYFRGTVENNWVKFANAYWRILRINGDDSIRMIYAGDASVIDALPNKSDILKNGYNDADTNYTQIGESAYNEYWKKDNVQETVNSNVSDDNAGVGYTYGNRDGIVGEDATYTHVFLSPGPTSTMYFSQEYTYDAAKDRFTLKDPIGLLGTEITEDYVGWYMVSRNSSSSASYVRKVISVEPSDGSSNAKIGYSEVRYGTTSKEKAQTNTNDSAIKTVVDAWYESHIKNTKYEQYIVDTLFCNDRSLGFNNAPDYSQLAYGTEKTKYRGYSLNYEIRLTCEQQNDRFTVDDEIMGNGDLIYPIGLLTADENHIAGGQTSINSSYYLYTGNSYWSLSPHSFSGKANVYYVKGSDGSYSSVTSFKYGVRPVINLKPNSLKFGDGSASNPYRIEE